MRNLLICLLLLAFSLPSFAFQDAITLKSIEKNKIRTKGTFWEILLTPTHLSMLNKLEPDLAQFEEIAYGDHKRHQLLICKPDSSAKALKKELIFFVHGGGWHIGKPEQHRFLASLLAKQGYTVVLPAYRLGPKFCYEDIQLDLDQALLKSLEYLQIPLEGSGRLILGGASAGGNLAALLAFDNQRLEKLGIPAGFVNGFFSLAGVLDINEVELSSVLKHYAGMPGSATFFLANPLHLVDESDQFNSLILHGTKDGLVDYASALSFVARLKQMNLPYTFFTLENKSHLVTTAKWYYKENKDFGQSLILLNWLKSISKG